MGGVFVYDKSTDELNRVAGTELTQFIGTKAKWNALPISEKAKFIGKEVIITDEDDEVNETISTEHRLNKDFYLESKTLQFFGDSIADGVGVEADSAFLANKRWTTKFSELMSATEENNAVSGSLYTRGKNQVTSITDTVKTTPLVGNCIFLCGGINDWQLGVELSEFEQSVTECFEYLKQNYNGDVIVLAPFNAIKNLVGTPITSIENYRIILSKLSAKYGFSFINGGKFSLGKTRNSGKRITYQYADGLHPSGFGHYLVASELFMLLSGINSWKEFPSSIGEHVFSGEYLSSLDIPIFRVTYSIAFSAEELANHIIDSKINNSTAVIQSMKGCIVYGANYSAALPYFTQTQDFVKTLVCYLDGNGFTIQHQGTLEITNGNIFIEYILTQLPKHTY